MGGGKLRPLLRHRERQSGGFYVETELTPGHTVHEWLASLEIGPGTGGIEKFPYYILLVGSPYQIPFSFQFDLSTQRAVGRLLEMTVADSSARKKGIKYGICGEHGGDPRSIRFCHDLGLDYVSCSPYRVPVARIAAAQANVDSQR